MMLSLSLVAFSRPNSSFAFYYLHHHVYTLSQEDHDEQKAIVVVKRHYQGYLLTRSVRVRESNLGGLGFR